MSLIRFNPTRLRHLVSSFSPLNRRCTLCLIQLDKLIHTSSLNVKNTRNEIRLSISNYNYFNYNRMFSSGTKVKGTPIKMPSLSPTMTEGKIVKWLKKEGDSISPGDVLCEVETDKAVVSLELEEEGILAKILVPEETSNIKIGTLIAVTVEEGQDWKNVEIPKVEEIKAEADASTSKQVEEKEVEQKTLIGPSVRNLLNQYGIDPNTVRPSGPHSTLLKSDVLQYIKDKNLKQLDGGARDEQSVTREELQTTRRTVSDYQDIELTSMRKTIAKRLTESKTTIPHVYMSIDCNMNSVIALRERMKKSVSVNDFIIKASGIALKKVPQVNATWQENSQSISLESTIDISMAVATPNGLITPIIRNANQLSIQEINKAARELAEKARAGKLQPNEFIGGTFSISNLGMFGITEFIAVINPPQAAILAVGGPRLTLGDNDKTQQLMTVTLSFDGRIIDEETAARFLEQFKSVLENPDEILSSDGSENRRLNALIG